MKPDMTHELFLYSAPDGLHAALYLPEEQFVAYKVFSHSATMFELQTWCDDPLVFKETTTMRPSTMPGCAVPISFNNDTGKLQLHTTGLLGKPVEFDPNDDESLARLVRRVKVLAPINHGQKTLPLPLPKPTKEQFDRRQVFTEVATAHGLGRFKAKTLTGPEATSAARAALARAFNKL